MAINLDVHGNTQPLEASVQAAVNRIRRQPIKISVDDKGATQPLGNMRRSADEFTKSMEAANARIIAFGASMAIINGMADAFKGMVRNMVEVEKALADINVVMGLSTQKLDAFSDGLFKVAQETGQAFKIAADAATEYARQGLSVEESLRRTKDALILTRLTGMDSAEAVKSLTAAMNTYGSQIKDTTQLVSKFAAVDVKFAVSAEDFADAIARTGAAAKGAGVDIDELIGLVTAAQQQTARGGKVIGNSFKTIFTRIGRTDTLNQLENLGIAVRDIEGKTLGAKRILTDLANTFDSLSEAQKAQIAQTVGGVFQINVLKAVLGDAAKQNGILASATQISAGATNEAIEKNEQLRDTMSAVATETGLAVKKVSAQVGELMLAPGIENVLNIVKSGAELLSGVLGDGESTGNKFATGFLKGLGNIISGPGLVVMTAVFGKLLIKAGIYAKESLNSLIGATSEAQKQKAIQSSLVNLFGRSSELTKEMLRTDISRTEKEKIILGLLKAQVLEAKALDSVAKSTAATLYSRGYGANLAPRRVKADGHIPNFAHPERQQAARGGYAAGNIRSMNMPGEGSVIYNSAETVKNFAGFKQPAIMPPQSSKAGKNYQQAFGNIHGFDPYASGGYIPNFNRGGQGINKSSPILNAINYAHMLTPDAGVRDVLEKPANPVYGIPKAQLPKVRFKKFGILPSASTRAENKKQNLVEQLHGAVEKSAVRQGQLLADSFKIGTGKASAKAIKDSMRSAQSGGAGALSSVVGALFEAAISTKIKQIKGQSGGVTGVASGIGGDFDLRNPTGEQKENLKILFGGSWSRTNLADYKSQDSTGNAQSMAEKILKEKIFRSAGKSTDPALAFAYGKKAGVDPRSQKRLLFARGYIPNFADPLSDAIGREKAAGVPVSQIRVGSHSALMSKGNPLGLGVTNTYDEPNGLKDVFGAKGYVPNYAFEDFRAKTEKGGHRIIDKDTQKQLKTSFKSLVKELKSGAIDIDSLGNEVKKLGSNFNLTQKSTQALQAKIQKEASKPSLLGSLSSINDKFANTTVGKGLSGGAGMGLMVGAPMLAGFLQEGREGETAQERVQRMQGGSYAAGGALMGAGTGAAMGMMFGPLGTAIGAVGGALYGLANSAKEASAAQKELSKSIGERKSKSILSSPVAEQAFGKIGTDQIAKLAALEKELQKSFEPQLKKKLAEIENTQRAVMSGTNIMVQGAGAALNMGFSSWEEKVKTESSVELNVEAAKQRKKALLEALKAVDPSQEFLGTDIKTGEQKKYTTSRFVQDIEELDVSKSEDQIALKEAFKNGRDLQEKANYEAEKVKKGIILQLNLQKAQLRAQKAAAISQLRIKDSYSKEAANLDRLTKLGGEFLTERQKAEIKYKEALLKASEQLTLKEDVASSGLRNKLLGIRDDTTTNFLKQALLERQEGFANKSDEEKKALAEKIELEKELAKLSEKELIDLYTKLDVDDQIKLKIENYIAAKQNSVDLAKLEYAITEDKLDAEKQINFFLAERKKYISDINRGTRSYVSQSESEQKIESFENEVARSRRLTARGPGYKTKTEQEEFDLKEKQYKMEEKIAQIKRDAAEKVLQLDAQAAKAKFDEQKMLELRGKIEESDDPFVAVLLNEQLESLEKTSTERQKTIQDTEASVKRITDETESQVRKERELFKEERKRLQNKQKYERSFSGGFREAAGRMYDDAQKIDRQLGTITANHFRDGLVTAMDAAIDRSKNLGDTLNNIAMNFLQAIQSAFLTSAANTVVGAMGLSQGGNVRKYSSGGGVPAMVSNGEYVMSRRAVNKYGSNFMHNLNARGKMQNLSSGGRPGSALAANFGSGKGFDSGRAYQGMPMSGFFYSGAAQSVALEEDVSTMQGMLAEERRRKQEAYQKKMKKRALRNQILSTALSVGLSFGADALFGGISNGGLLTADAKAAGYTSSTPKGTTMGTNSAGQAVSYAPGVDPLNYFSKPTRSFNPLDWFRGESLGGRINKYASGGYISGKSGIDQIPAMLSEGEYVIKASSARQIGKPTLDRINAGKFYNGGLAGEDTSQVSQNNSSSASNNINITLNLDKTGKSSEQKSEEGDDNSKGERDRMKELTEKIKLQVLAVIVEEQRPGGLLEETRQS